MKLDRENLRIGFWRTIGTVVATSLLAIPPLCIPAVREQAIRLLGGHGPLDRAVVTIFLIALIAVLLGLLIHTRISYSRFRMKVYEKKVTDEELQPEAIKKGFDDLKAKLERFRQPKQTFENRLLSWLLKL